VCCYCNQVQPDFHAIARTSRSGRRLLGDVKLVMAKPVFLVVDNDKDSLDLMVRDLERRYANGYRIIGQTSPHEALQTLQQLKRDDEPVALLLVEP
jgi:hypothetical protein